MNEHRSSDAIIVEPAGPASAAVIWLHGLGADGDDFVPIVPELRLPAAAALRFVFPHAPVRPVTLNGGLPMRAWYDIRALTVEGREDLQGITASAQRIEALIAAQTAAGIPAARIVLAGFSQGGALALHVALRRAQPLAGLVALSTYLPLRGRFEAEAHPASRALPILLAHGDQDAVVRPEWGEATRAALVGAGYPVDWRVYPMGHAVCAAEIGDIAAFLRRVLAL